MLRFALLALPLVACVAPVEDYHSVTWTVDASIENCTEVSMTVRFEGRTETHDGYNCVSSGGFTWMSDDPPLSVELTALHVWEEPCEGASSLWCTTREAQEIVALVEGELDLANESTALVLR